MKEREKTKKKMREKEGNELSQIRRECALTRRGSNALTEREDESHCSGGRKGITSPFLRIIGLYYYDCV